MSRYPSRNCTRQTLPLLLAISHLHSNLHKCPDVPCPIGNYLNLAFLLTQSHIRRTQHKCPMSQCPRPIPIIPIHPTHQMVFKPQSKKSQMSRCPMSQITTATPVTFTITGYNVSSKQTHNSTVPNVPAIPLKKACPMSQCPNPVNT